MSCRNRPGVVWVARGAYRRIVIGGGREEEGGWVLATLE